MSMPVRADEEALWEAVAYGSTPRRAGEVLGIASRRVEYLCGKWARQGRYDYGVAIDLGWAVP